MSRPQRLRVVLGVAVPAALVVVLVSRCAPDAGAPPAAARVPVAALVAVEAPSATPPPPPVPVASPPPAKTPAARTHAAPPAKGQKTRKKKLLADVDPKDFEVTGIAVTERGYRATIDGWIRLTRRGTLAQPRLVFDLKDGNGNVIRSGSFTPVDATGPVWLGYDALGLKRVPFSTTIDLRADGGVLPAVPPRPYSATVRVAEVIDAKPAAR